MNILDLILKILALVSLVIVRVYWNAAQQEADLKLPSSITKRTRFRNRFRVIEILFYLVLVIQCFIYPIMPFEPNFLTRIFGVLLFIAGVQIGIAGRMTLGINWNHMIDYQVKEKQALVTDGIYHYVRHPIYAGFLFMLTAIEILLHSWLVIILFAIVFAFIYLQSVKEESILARHFGKEYLQYMHHSKMFIPYVF